MCHKSRLKAVKGDVPIENKVQARLHPSKLADFTFCSPNQKGVKSVEAVPERMFPKSGRKERNKKTPLLRRCRGMKERFSNGCSLLECWMCWIGFSFLECSVCSVHTGSSSSIPFVLFRVLDFVESVFSLPSASLAIAELFSLCSLSFFRVSDL